MRGRGFRGRVGLLGGSFNPAHDGHRHVAQVALRALRLDEVWLMVSPGNPLKPVQGMAPFAARFASAARVARGARLRASDAEARLGTRITWMTLRRLGQRFPAARFVFVIGADNLAQLPRWQRWLRLARQVPIAVLPRPGYTRAALGGRAATVLRGARRRAGALLESGLPAWCFIPARLHAASATAIRALDAKRA